MVRNFIGPAATSMNTVSAPRRATPSREQLHESGALNSLKAATTYSTTHRQRCDGFSDALSNRWFSLALRAVVMPEPLYGYSVEQHIEATGAEVLSAEHLALPGGDMIAPLQLPKVPMVSCLMARACRPLIVLPASQEAMQTCLTQRVRSIPTGDSPCVPRND